MEIASDIARALRHTLESLERAGVTHLKMPTPGRVASAVAMSQGDRAASAGSIDPPKRPVDGATKTVLPDPEPDSSAGVAGTRPMRESKPPTASLLEMADGERISSAPRLSRDEKSTQLQVLQGDVAGCTRCTELAETRTQTVFGVGDPNARLLFVGEAPGADEDAQGQPFVGRAGQLLTDIITKGMKLRREDVYILNVLKCRPPNNRTPEQNEVINCRGFLDRQLEIIQPEFICCLGSVAAKAILNTDISIGRLRGKFHEYLGIPVLCTYHPAYLLRNPAAKKEVWDDIQVLMKRMGLPGVV